MKNILWTHLILKTSASKTSSHVLECKQASEIQSLQFQNAFMQKEDVATSYPARPLKEAGHCVLYVGANEDELDAVGVATIPGAFGINGCEAVGHMELTKFRLML